MSLSRLLYCCCVHCICSPVHPSSQPTIMSPKASLYTHYTFFIYLSLSVSMESLVYEDVPDADARLKRMKVALSAFVALRATAPVATAILVPVVLAKAALRAKEALAAAAAQLRRACSDRVQLRKWLKHEVGVAMDIWVVAAVDPRDTAELACLSHWQSDQHLSPLRQADAVSISLREVALLLGGGQQHRHWRRRQQQQRAPMLTQFLLSHQSLLIDLSCCFGNGNCPLIDPVVFSFIRANNVAKGRTSVLASYSAWLPLMATSRGLARLQEQIRALAKHVLSPTQLPFCCAYGGGVEALQHNLVTLPSPGGTSNESPHSRISAALSATRSLKDIFSLVGVLLSRPEVNYYSEAMAFCASVQRRRRAAGFVYQATCSETSKTSDMLAAEVGGEEEKGRSSENRGKRKRYATPPSSAARGQAQEGRGGRIKLRAASSGCSASNESVEPPLWCEDVGN